MYFQACAFKLSFDVHILVLGSLFPKFRQNFIQFSGHTGAGHQVLPEMYVISALIVGHPWRMFGKSNICG
jgi:hypothetical protein